MQKKSDKIQHGFLVKVLSSLGMQILYLNAVKAIYDKPITNIILNVKNLNCFL
jgi:hypothetical protein